MYTSKYSSSILGILIKLCELAVMIGRCFKLLRLKLPKLHVDFLHFDNK